MGKPPLNFFRNEKKNYNGKKCPNMPCFECIVEHFVLAIILICFPAFANLDFLNLHCGAFICNLYKKKHHHRNLSKSKGGSFC